MLQEYLTAEIVVLAGGIACLFAVVALALAGRHAFVRGMASKLAAIETQISERQRILEDVGKKMAEAAELQKRVDLLERRLAALQQDIQPLEGKHLKALGDYEDAKAKLREAREEWLQMRDRVDVYKERIAKIDALERELSELESRRASLEELVKSLPERQKELAHLERAIAERTKQAEELQKALKRLASDNDALAEKLSAAKKALEQCDEEMQRRREDMRKLESDLEEMRRREKHLAGKLEGMDLKIRNAGRLPVEAFTSLQVPICPEDSETDREKREEQWLRRFTDQVRESGFDLPLRLQRAFHAALKTSDLACLTVMAGVSGTGKSALPRIYARAMGMHFLPIAVEPRWDSPHDLFGFLNYMENRYEAAPLGRALRQFNCSPSEAGELSDQILMVLLDEMNLARIEYYFSEFLSRLELRRDVDLEREEDYRKVSMEIFAGNLEGENGNEAEDAIRLFAGRNVLFVGTMNEDETTQSLSDKVIDRANVLHFGRPGKLKNIESREPPSGEWAALPLATWQSWIVDANGKSISSYEDLTATLSSLNLVLGQLGRPFAHRTFQAVLKYVANHPDVKLDKRAWHRPVADQMVMRIMPKLRGIDLNEHAAVFTQLTTLVEKLQDKALSKAFAEAKGKRQGYFHWSGIDWGLEE